MITLKEQEILEEVYKGSRRAKMDIHSLLSKVYDEELALDLNRQAAGYSRLEEKAESELLSSGIMPERGGVLERTRRWAGLQASTALNISTGHIADLVGQTEQETLERIKEVLRESSAVKSRAKELAMEFKSFEEENLRVLGAYRS